jgi:O-antigen/teichoic acid export membrane protein
MNLSAKCAHCCGFSPSGAYATGRGAAAVLRFLIGLALVLFVSRDVVSLVYAIATANLLVAIPMLLTLRTDTFRPLPSKPFVRTLAAYGIPLIGWMLCSHVLQISDRYIIEAFRGSAEVGIYSANYNIVVMGFGLVSTPILLAAHPIIMDAWEHDRHDDIPRVIARFSRYYLIATAPVFAFVAVFSAEIVSLVLGETFREGHRIMPILLAGVLAWGMSMYGHKGLELAERTRTLLALIVLVAVTNVVLNLVIVPRFGYVGAAYTTVGSFLLYPALVYPITRSSIPWLIPWAGAVKVALCALGAAVVFWGVRAGLEPHAPVFVWLVVAGVLGLAVYGVLLFATRVLSRDELSGLG